MLDPTTPTGLAAHVATQMSARSRDDIFVCTQFVDVWGPVDVAGCEIDQQVLQMRAQAHVRPCLDRHLLFVALAMRRLRPQVADTQQITQMLLSRTDALDSLAYRQTQRGRQVSGSDQTSLYLPTQAQLREELRRRDTLRSSLRLTRRSVPGALHRLQRMGIVMRADDDLYRLNPAWQPFLRHYERYELAVQAPVRDYALRGVERALVEERIYARWLDQQERC